MFLKKHILQLTWPSSRPQSLCCNSPTGVCYKILTVSFPTTDTCDTRLSARSYTPSGRATRTIAWTDYRSLSCSRPTQSWLPFRFPGICTGVVLLDVGRAASRTQPRREWQTLYLILRDKKCSNLSCTLDSISQHDLWTPENFTNVPCPSIFLGFISHHLKWAVSPRPPVC